MRAIALLMACWSSLVMAQPAAQAVAPVLLLSQSGAIGPASADHLRRGLEKAVELKAQLVVLKMDTPGGLDLSMRAIVTHILASPIPVVCFVAPDGARAASAGTYILYASHIAAMAPATNLGAATPVALGSDAAPPMARPSGAGKARESLPPQGKPEQDVEPAADAQSAAQTMNRKQTNDAAAYIRGLAQLRGRNAEWADKAVREGVSLSAQEALELKVIDLIAADVPHLLKLLDGRRATVLGQEIQLATGAAAIVEFPADWRTRLLVVITDPGIAYLLLMIGFYGLLFEFYSPGLIAPGVIGGISLLLALFALQLLPVSYTGLALIALGVGLLVMEHFAPGFGILGLGGITAFVMGSIMLLDTDAPGYRIPWPLIAGVAAAGAGLLLVVLNLASGARRRPVVSGREQMIGAEGEVVADTDGGVYARINGELWHIQANAPLGRGQMVRVTGIAGLMLAVEPIAQGDRK